MANRTNESVAFEAYMMQQNKKAATVSALVAIFETPILTHFLQAEIRDGFAGWVERWIEARPQYKDSDIVKNLFTEVKAAEEQEDLLDEAKAKVIKILEEKIDEDRKNRENPPTMQ